MGYGTFGSNSGVARNAAGGDPAKHRFTRADSESSVESIFFWS